MLTGKNVRLRSLRAEDIHKTNVWRNDLELIRVTQGTRYPSSIEMDEIWFDRVLKDMSNRNIYFAIEEVGTSDYIGMVHLSGIDYLSGTSNWGIIIGDRSKQGKGYSIEAQNLLFEYAFEELNLKKLNSYVVNFNNACIKMLDKLGSIKKEGKLERHYYTEGAYHDIYIFAIFKEDFIKNK